VIGKNDRRPGPVTLLAGLLVLAALVQIFSLGASALGYSLNRSFSLATLVLATVGALLFALGCREPANQDDDPPLPLIWRLVPILPIIWFLWIWSCLINLGAGRPCYDWDGLYYHLPAIHGWALSGRVSWLHELPDLPFANGYPMGLEVCNFLLFQITSSQRWLDAGNLWFWPLALAAVATLARCIGIRGLWAWGAGALICGSPIFINLSLTSYSDPLFAATAIASLAAAIIFIFHDEIPLWRRIIMFGAALGLMVGSKGLGAPFAVVILGGAMVAVLWRRGLSSIRKSVWQMSLVVAVMVAVGGYWSIRNLVYTGNPIFPVELRLGEKLLAEGYTPESLIIGNMPESLKSRPPILRPWIAWWDGIKEQSPDSVSGMGLIWLFAGLPAALTLLVIVLLSKERRRHAPLIFLGLISVVLFLVGPANWWDRFVLWLHGLGLPCLALLIYKLAAARRPLPTVLAALVTIGALGIVGLESQRTLDTEIQRGLVPVAGESPATEHRTRYLGTMENYFGELEHDPLFKRMLSSGKLARCEWSHVGTLLGGMLSLPPGQREILFLPRDSGEAEQARLIREQTEWIIWDELGAGPTPAALEEMALEAGDIDPYPDLDLRLIRIR
jgi:hypothetical protein